MSLAAAKTGQWVKTHYHGYNWPYLPTPTCMTPEQFAGMLAPLHAVAADRFNGTKQIWLHKAHRFSLRRAEDYVGRSHLSWGKSRFVTLRQIEWLIEQVTEKHSREVAACVAHKLK